MATKTAKEKELMNTKMKMRTLSLLLCFVMLVGLMPTSVFAAGTKLETPQNLKLQGTMLSWDAVDNADFYGVTLYHPNYVYSIGSWQTDGTNINLYKYLKDGETYGATVIACSNSSYQISNPAEIPLTACTNAGVPIYRDVNVVNGTSSASTAYPGMSVRLEAKPAPAGMVFDRWELSGGYISIGYSDTDTTIYVQAICDNDISARATYKYQENVTSAFTVQPQGGATLVGKSFNVTYAMNFTPQGTVKVQVEGNTPGSFTDLKQGTIDSASIKEDSVVTKTFRIMASDGTRNIYSDEFVVSWEDGPRFISQPVGGTVGHNVDYVATYALNFTPFSCRVERYNDYLGQWSELSFASATEATISSYDFNTSSKYRIKAIIQGGGEVYSDEFTVTWSDAVSKFIQHPVSGTVGLDEDFSFTFAINFTPVSNIAIQKYNSGFDSWDTVGYCTSLTSGTISGFASETTNKYRLEAYENGNPIRSNEFTVTWEGTDYTVSFAANGGSGTMADVNNVSGEYTLPTCGFTAPNGQRFKAWLVGGNEKAVGDKITVSANTVVTAVWENIPEYIVSYNANGGSGTMVGDMVEENGKFTLENCTYSAPEGYKFKAWAIGSVNGEQKQPSEQITITAETYIYAIWEAVEYNVTVTGGTASVGAGTPITKATMGTTVTLTADPAPFGKMFDKWVVTGVVVADANNATTTFVMPAGNVTAEATYKNAPHTHTFDQEIVKDAALKTAADCTHDAVYYKSCSCGAISTDDADTFTAINSALGHAWPEEGSWSKDADKHWYECSRCHLKKDEAAHDYGDDDICDICTYDNSVPHTHNLTLVDENPATCTTPGNKAYYTCDGCDKWFEDASGSVEITDKTSVILTANGHTPSDWKFDADNHWKECTVVGCGVIIEDSKAAHTASDWIIDTAATATTDGTKHKECTECGYVMETGTIPATGSGEHTHSYGSDWKSNADKHWHECSCGDKAEEATHTASDWITDTAATATTDGTKHKECTECGYVMETGTIAATGGGEHTHSYSSDWKSDSINHWHECSCGVKDDVAAHSFKWVVDKEATATKKGSKHEECKFCGYQRPAVEIPVTGSTTKPTDPTESNPNTGALDDVPQTGDNNNNMILWIVLLLTSGLGVTITVVYSKRKKHAK